MYCTIYVEQESQKGIVIGRGGEMLKRVRSGTEARQDLEAFFETKVFLDLHVKVNADWRENDRVLDDLGVPRTSRRRKWEKSRGGPVCLSLAQLSSFEIPAKEDTAARKKIDPPEWRECVD